MCILDEELTRRVKALFKKEYFHEQHAGAMHAALGVAGEAGEIIDAVKRGWAYGKPLDRENLIEELGDIEFYLEALRQSQGISRDETLTANNTKLMARYPDGSYTDAAAQNRADK